MNLLQARTIAGTLSFTNKMPGADAKPRMRVMPSVLVSRRRERELRETLAAVRYNVTLLSVAVDIAARLTP